ncbi:p-hydroxybenzoic acid efflux pump subunit AaeA [Sinobacterium norvegicum]|uniref:p-hydroxybenzoic acid efflux pump subunit AaeA n=1 Tax=Sinobacterium norvegicum TaxID=1641715 RepID=A0ABM9AC45_9GAMM|nr:efflux RND transporter periplasmic adaptor subunit [Sinobacterium norvegicum]CAH0990536.1 p-hydroxybenzoic acid efflux pump subunit AaeA [Sinobacterium norvegicum]
MKRVLAIMISLTASTPVLAQSYDCLVEPWQRVEISFDDKGLIETIEVERSQRVSQGEKLATLKSGLEQATVDLRSAKAAMKQEVAVATASLQYARRNLQRIEGLYGKKAVPFSVYDEAKTEAEVANQRLNTANSNRHLAALDLSIAQQLLARRTVTSPIDGVVTELIRAEGEYVKDEPVLVLEQMDPLRVQVLLPVEKFGSVNAGEYAQLQLFAPLDDEQYQAEVVVVDRGIDVASGTFGVQLELANPDFSLPSGLKCHVVFSTDSQSVASQL